MGALLVKLAKIQFISVNADIFSTYSPELEHADSLNDLQGAIKFHDIVAVWKSVFRRIISTLLEALLTPEAMPSHCRTHRPSGLNVNNNRSKQSNLAEILMIFFGFVSFNEVLSQDQACSTFPPLNKHLLKRRTSTHLLYTAFAS